MSDTPETDAQKWRYFDDAESEEHLVGVDIEFARKLERERNALAEALRKAVEAPRLLGDNIRPEWWAGAHAALANVYH